MGTVTDKMVRQAIPLFNVLAFLLIGLTLFTLLMLGKEVLIPLALALLLSFALTPVAGFFQKIGLGRGASVPLSVLLAFILIVVVAYIVIVQMSDLAAQLPAYKIVIRDKLRALVAGISESGPFSRAGTMIGELIEDVKIVAGAAPDIGKSTAVVVSPQGSSGVELATTTLGQLVHPLSMTAAVFLISGFLLGQREDLRNRLIRLVGTDDLQQTTAALDDAGYRLGKLLLTQLLVNATFAVVVGLGLWAIGLPSPFLWGILAGLLRFLPYIGAVIGLVPPLLIAFAFDPTWSSFLWTIGLFALIEPIVGHVIEPLLYGRSTGLSPVAVVVSAIVWVFLWGPIGLVLATPLTICMVVLGRHVKRLKFLDILLGDRPALAPHEMFYQRMLAGDPAEAADQARAFLKKRTLATYYDEVALNAIRRAQRDVLRGSVEGKRLERLVIASNTLVHTLGAEQRARLRLLPVNSEVEAAFEVIRTEAPKIALRLDRTSLTPLWQGKTPVAILYGDHSMDEVPARMLAHVLSDFGLPSRVLHMAGAGAAPPEELAGISLVILSFIEPMSLPHLRAASLQVHRRLPNAKVVMCFWQETDPQVLEHMQRKLRVNGIATSTAQTLKITQGLLLQPAAPQI